MTKLEKKDNVRKIRRGTRENTISLTNNYLKEKNLVIGDSIDLSNAGKVDIVENE